MIKAITNVSKLTLFVAVLVFSGMANAITISGGEIFTVDWFVDLDDGITSSDLTATSTWTVSSFNATEILLDININNTTVLETGILDEAAIVSFGFGVEPDATVALATAGSVFDLVSDGNGTQQTFPGGFKQIDVCLFADGCTGGDVKNGLQAGASDTLQVLLSGAFGTSADLLFFPAKFQTTLGSFEPGGSTSIPEPSALVLMGLGLLGLSFTRRWKLN